MLMIHEKAGPHFYTVRKASASVDAFQHKLAARMVNLDAPCRLSDLLPVIHTTCGFYLSFTINVLCLFV